MNKILFNYLIGKFKRNKLKKIVNIIILIPIFCIIQMFSTAIRVEQYNKNYFINNGQFKNMIVSEKDLNMTNSFYEVEGTAGVDKKKQGQAIFKKSKSVKIYTPSSNVKFDETLFSKKNWLSGEFEELKESSNGIDIAVDFNTMKRLGLKQNGKFLLAILQHDTGEWTILNCNIKAVLLNSSSEQGTILMPQSVKYETLFKKLSCNIVSFTNNEMSSVDKSKITTKKQLMLSSSKSEQSNIGPNVLFPLMGLVLTFLIINRDINFNINRSKKSIAVLNSLGVQYKNITKALMVYEFFDIVVASLISIIIYKYVIFQGYMNMYVVPIFLLYVFLATLLVGIFATVIGFVSLNKKLNRMSVIDMLSAKELM